MTIKIDTQAGAAYIRLKEGKVHATKEILPEVFADYNNKKELLGVELVSPCVVTLRKLARQLHLPILNRIRQPLEQLCHGFN